MRKFTHRWQRKSCILLMVMAFGGANPALAALKSNIIIRPVDWPITGKVTSASGETLPGVTVLLKGSTIGTATDVNGNFSINVPETSGTLIFSFIGYTSLERTFSGPGAINVRLEDDAKALQEVVVTGYGTQQKRDVTGAVTSVKGDELARTPTPTVAQALQGRAAGVQVSANSGAPGASSTINIRGRSSVNNVDVLYVVDGIQVSGNINYLNNDDIASVEVLKDASAAAIYGSRAAGGVILITTKRGKANTSQFNFSAYTGIQNTWRRLDLTNSREYAEIDNLSRRAAGLPTNPDWANPSSLSEGTDWQDELFRTAKMSNYQLGWSGGSENSTLFVSGSYFKREGIIIGTEFDRFTFRLNTDHQVAKKVKIGNTLQLSATNTDQIPNNQDLNNGVLSRGVRQLPTVPVYNADGSFAGPTGNFQGESENPVFLALRSYDNAKDYRMIGSVYADVDIYNGLSFRSTFNLDAYMYDNSNFNPSFAIGNRVENVSSLGVNTGNGRGWQWSNILTYKRTFGDHNINALAGIEAQDFFGHGYSASRTTFPKNDAIRYLDLGTAGDAARGNAFSNSLYSQLARVNYDFQDKYLLTATIRRDGSSKTANYRYGVFPSASLGWRISEEEFFRSIPAFSSLMFRAGYGEVGNQGPLSNYPTYALISAGPRYPFNEVVNQGYYPAVLSNPDIRWETVAQTNFGLDAAFFDNRLTATADYFIKNTNDMIVTIPIPSSTGAAPAATNAGELQNKGFEISLNYQNTTSNDFTYGLGVNMTRVRNNVVNLGGQTIATEFGRTVEGQPIAQFYGYITEGIYRTQADLDAANAYAARVKGDAKAIYQPLAKLGDIKFKDVNGDGAFTSDDQDYFGNPFPDFTAGLTGNAAYKGFDFNFLFNSSFGNDVLNRLSAFGYAADAGNKFRAIINNTWTPENPNAEYPRLIIGDPNGNNRGASDRWLESGTFVRLKNFQLGYTLPAELLSRVGSKSVRIYLSGENVLTWTKYKSGFDPEQGTSYNNLDLGVDRGIYPQARTFLIGINVGF